MSVKMVVVIANKMLLQWLSMVETVVVMASKLVVVIAFERGVVMQSKQWLQWLSKDPCNGCQWSKWQLQWLSKQWVRLL